ncbi:SpoIIE family protein phosphatase [Actinospica durhamensis]|uniref:SpoIIE family protein phosphatase n=1 Tax=Actinospica durhamensis TaxID=1508375 RepID=A0A941INB5_9ACTN|nr:SpoIIE family protein phosphatase [Actinospica durhamensis]MBR7833789.1 SpoIIE family protein phosphatase [Actinospica durhamensis]
MLETSEVDAAVLAALFDSPISLYVLDSALRLVRFNPSARRLRDFPIAGVMGQPVSEVLRLFDLDQPERAAQLARDVLETGTPVLDEWFTARSRDPVVESVHSVAYFRLHDREGGVLGVLVAVTDVTTRAAAEERVRLLNLASTRIGTTLDVYQTAMEMCDVSVPRLADAVAVDVLDSLLRGEVPPPGAVLKGQSLRRAGFFSVSGRQGVPAVGEGSSYPYDTPYDRVLATLRPQLIPQLDPDALWLERDQRGNRLRDAGVHSMMSVPLSARGSVLGLASFYRWQNPVPFDAADLELAEQVGAVAALCLDNARLYTRERSVARLQGASGRRPGEESVRSAVETAHAYRPAGAGGAWFDVIALSGSRVALVVGDSTGLGAHAAAAMGELRAASAALSGLDLLPDELLERLHVMAGKPHRREASTDGSAEGEARRETCLYVVYDPATRICSAASADHPPPIVAYADGRVEELDVPQGPPLGHGAAQYDASEHELPEGAVLLLRNDAFIQTGWDGATPHSALLTSAATSPDVSLKDVCDALMNAAAFPPERDAIVLLARTHALHPSQTASWTLPATFEAAGQARRLATTQLKDWGIEALSDSTELVVSELVTNALRYAEGPIGLRLICDRTLTCEVTDDSNTAPRLRRAHDDDEGGRGLFITEQLTQRWGARPNRQGKTIWAEQPLESTP